MLSQSPSGFILPVLRVSTRARVIRVLMHIVVGLALGVFLLPEGAAVVLAGAFAAAAAKAFYDYLQHRVDIIACLGLAAGAAATLLANV